MRISDILRHKTTTGGASVVTLGPADSVATLLATLATHNIGAVVVLDGGDVAGIVSERDIVRRIAEAGAGLLERTVAEIMTPDVVSCSVQDNVDDVAATMTERRVRHMPVLADSGGLAGVVSIGDVVAYRIRQLEQDRGQLEHYITG